MNEEKNLREVEQQIPKEVTAEGQTLEVEDVKAMKALNPMIILAIIIILAAVATYIVPAGTFERVGIPGYEDNPKYSTIVPGSFEYVENEPIGVFDFFTSFTLGLQDAGYIIFFLLIVGGVFAVVEATGALHAGLSNMIRRLAGKELLLIPICMVIFAVISAFAACAEEYLAFLPLIYVVCVACGFDSITAVSLTMVASAVGYAGGMTNAFTVGVAQTIAGLPLFSGMGLRIVIFVVLLIITTIYVMLHARKVKRDPLHAPMYAIDLKYAEKMDLEEIQPITGRQKGVLAVFSIGFVAIAFCVIQFGFYIDEMAAIFIIMGLLCAIIGGLKPGEVADSFVEGCKNLLWAGLIIGMCTAATNILSNAMIMDTIVNGLGNLLDGLSAQVSVVGMFFIQDIMNFLVSSGSGQAAITMPFMAPLSDLLGVSRQTAVMAFQLGDAFTNAIAPTCGDIMAALAICHVPYKKWLRFMLPLWGIWCVVGCGFLIYATTIGY